MITFRAGVLNPMSDVQLSQILAQSLGVGKTVLGFGFVVEVKEGQAIDNRPWHSLSPDVIFEFVISVG